MHAREWKAAEESFQKVMELESSQGSQLGSLHNEERSHEWALAGNDLACVLLETARPEEALNILTEVARIEDEYGQASDDSGIIDEFWRNELRVSSAITMVNHAVALSALGRWDEACAAYTRALDVQQAFLPESDMRIAETCTGFGILCHSQGNTVQAEVLYRKALTIQMESKPVADPLVLGTLSHLASLYEGVLGSDEKAASSLSNLGCLYAANERPEEAEKYFRRALSLLESSVPPTSPTLLTLIEKLSLLYEGWGPGRETDLDALYRRTQVIRRYAA